MAGYKIIMKNGKVHIADNVEVTEKVATHGELLTLMDHSFFSNSVSFVKMNEVEKIEGAKEYVGKVIGGLKVLPMS